MTEGPWLNLPQAVVVEATGDIQRALELTERHPALLVMKANELIALRTEVPLAADAAREQRHEAFIKLPEARGAARNESRYLQTEQQVLARLVAGVRTKASRTPDGPYQSVDPVEFTRVELRGLDAIDKRTKSVLLYDLRIHGPDFLENLRRSTVNWGSAASSQKLGHPHEDALRDVEKWDCAGDPLPKLIEWARSGWGEDPQKLPDRQELLRRFRAQFGRVAGINEKTMRDVRRQLAPPERRRGGGAMHRR